MTEPSKNGTTVDRLVTVVPAKKLRFAACDEVYEIDCDSLVPVLMKFKPARCDVGCDVYFLPPAIKGPEVEQKKVRCVENLEMVEASVASDRRAKNQIRSEKRRRKQMNCVRDDILKALDAEYRRAKGTTRARGTVI
jgi:hypothetical protein